MHVRTKALWLTAAVVTAGALVAVNLTTDSSGDTEIVAFSTQNADADARRLVADFTASESLAGRNIAADTLHVFQATRDGEPVASVVLDEQEAVSTISAPERTSLVGRQEALKVQVEPGGSPHVQATSLGFDGDLNTGGFVKVNEGCRGIVKSASYRSQGDHSIRDCFTLYRHDREDTVGTYTSDGIPFDSTTDWIYLNEVNVIPAAGTDHRKAYLRDVTSRFRYETVGGTSASEGTASDERISGPLSWGPEPAMACPTDLGLGARGGLGMGAFPVVQCGDHYEGSPSNDKMKATWDGRTTDAVAMDSFGEFATEGSEPHFTSLVSMGISSCYSVLSLPCPGGMEQSWEHRSWNEE